MDKKYFDLKSAIIRLGAECQYTASLSIVMTQLMRAKGMAEFADTTHALWEHSIQTSAAAYVLAQENAAESGRSHAGRSDPRPGGFLHALSGNPVRRNCAIARTRSNI